MPRIAADDLAARPFLKWAGGKTQLLDAYQPLLPRLSSLATYHEPFVGAGAMYFHLRRTGFITGRAVLSDLNEDLVLTWQCVRDEPEALAARLAELIAVHDSDAFYRERERFNSPGLPPLERAALLIYLNKTGFNGLFRVNKSGHFNVPVGRQSTVRPSVPSAAQLQACSAALRGADILAAPFASVLDRAREGDFVYFDPPYVPVSATSTFTAYACDGFGEREQELLRDVFVQLDRRGCRVMLSNSGSFEVLRLYRDHDITQVSARRSINSKADARGPVTEVVIRNYGGSAD